MIQGDDIFLFVELLEKSFYSLLRILVAYLLSLAIAISVSYVALLSRKVERMIIALVDILQSVPVLSFTPGVMIFIAEKGRIGAEFSAVILIITSMLWNLIFSYYISLKSLPEELTDASQILKLGPARRFLSLDFPYSIPSLTWNSLLSFASAWYFLMYCEMFQLGEKQFNLPGIGSYILENTEKGDILKVALGFASISTIIVISYILIWFPLVRLSGRFKYEEGGASDVFTSKRDIITRVFLIIFSYVGKKIFEVAKTIDRFMMRAIKVKNIISELIFWLGMLAISLALIKLIFQFTKLELMDIYSSLFGLLISLVRVSIGVGIAGLVAIPAGIILGLRRDFFVRFQPAVQVLSSIPATAFVPVVFSALKELPFGMHLNSLFVIFFSSVWYIFFNTVSGVMSIPSETFEVAKVLRMSTAVKLKKIIFPASAKEILVGIITAWGGAWNGTFVAEYITFEGRSYVLHGIGGIIASSAEQGNIPLMLFATALMCGFIALFNLLVWRPLIEKLSKR